MLPGLAAVSSHTCPAGAAGAGQQGAAAHQSPGGSSALPRRVVLAGRCCSVSWLSPELSTALEPSCKRSGHPRPPPGGEAPDAVLLAGDGDGSPHLGRLSWPSSPEDRNAALPALGPTAQDCQPWPSTPGALHKPQVPEPLRHSPGSLGARTPLRGRWQPAASSAPAASSEPASRGGTGLGEEGKWSGTNPGTLTQGH